MIDMEIVDFFMEEAEELFDGINSILLKNEEIGEISKEEIDSLFRNIHTIKGGAGSVGLINVSNYTHHLETFLDSIREGEVEFSRDVINFFIDSVSNIQDILEKEYEGNIDENEVNDMIEDLKEQISQFMNTKEEKIHQEISSSSAGEILDLFENIFHILNEVEASDSVEGVAIDELFRYVHTLKGSSQFLYLSYFPTYMHDIENILDDVREKRIPYTMELNTFLLNSLYIAQEMIDLELNGKLESEKFEKELKALKEEIKEFEKKDENSPAFEIFDDELDVDMAAFEIFDDETDTKTSKKTANTVSQKKEEKQTIPKKTIKNKKDSKKQETSIKKVASSSSIRVNLDKIDNLMNRVGDLVITKSMLFQFADNLKKHDEIYKKIVERLDSLDRDIRELQESVMSVRMVPMESVYARLPKMVRDLARKLNKKVKFEHFGDNVEIDKMMVEGLMDPLTHIIRNSLDHGIETPEIRKEKGKKESGTLTISASQESGNIIISIKDDGAGIDVDKVVKKALENSVINEEDLNQMSFDDKVMLVFSPGLSTAEKVSDVSGRGVGMDVVMNNINSLGGKVEVKTEYNKGSEFKIILPLTLAILDGLNVMVGDRKFILPLSTIVESLQPKEHMIKKIGKNNKEILMLRNEFIPIIKLYDFFGIETKYTDFKDGMLIIVKTSNTKVAIFVDDFLNQEQIVVKSLEKNYKKIKGIGAATIRGDGSIGLILDVMNIVEESKTIERGGF
jgi:two-component system chemotaxis sensor kinase CheA